MVSPRYQGVDDMSRPFTITARVAQQVGSEQILDLEAPRGDMVLTDGGWVHVSADTGRYDRPRHHLDLAGDVTIHHDNGMTLRTEEAAVEVEAGNASGDTPVAAQGPFGTLDPKASGCGTGAPWWSSPAARTRAGRRTGMRVKALLGLAFLALLAAGPVAAQGIDLSRGGPVDVTATDGIEWRQAEQVVIARGDARAVRGGATVDADRLVARYRPSRSRGAAPATPASAGRTPEASSAGAARSGGWKRRAMSASPPQPIPPAATARSTMSTRRCWCSPDAPCP